MAHFIKVKLIGMWQQVVQINRCNHNLANLASTGDAPAALPKLGARMDFDASAVSGLAPDVAVLDAGGPWRFATQKVVYV